ncbi:MAG TPA: hypothetical protein VJ249_01850 [Candidatus Bathyarchaeia archaeon]|nr:hypothetical protein [Candidatus Bathyarchaeia archaeon]
MFLDPRQAFWYIIGGLLLLSAGLITVSGVTIPYALPIMLALAGGIIITAGLLGFRPTFPAFAVFMIGIVAFGLVASGPAGLTAYTTVETYELSRAQAPAVEEVDLSIAVGTGSIKLSFTSNQSQIYRVVFTKQYGIFLNPSVGFTYSVNAEELTVNATSTAVTVDITLNQNLKSRLHLIASTGNIQADVPAAATRVERLILTATTGNVQADLANTEQLRELEATTATGSIEATIKSSFQTRDATVQLKTSTGLVKLNLTVTNIESDIVASTTTGRVNADDTIGFTIVAKSSTSFHAQTPEYATSPFRQLDITATTTTGNVDITARHS